MSFESIATTVERLHNGDNVPESELQALINDNESFENVISNMIKLGYVLERNKGYLKMVHTTCRLLPWELLRGLCTRTLGKRPEYYESLESTQKTALEMLRQGKTDGHMVVARTQTSGMGRRKRQWVSLEGGIWMSIILKSTPNVSLLTLVGACALCDAIRDTLGVKVYLVWPNDLIVYREDTPYKISGIIADTDSQIPSAAVLGVGINFEVDETEINANIHDSPLMRAASLVAKGTNTSPTKTVQAFLQNIENMLDSWTEHGKIASEFSKRTIMIGRTVSVKTRDTVVSGIVSRIDNDGALIINEKGKDVRFVSGDVVRIS